MARPRLNRTNFSYSGVKNRDIRVRLSEYDMLQFEARLETAEFPDPLYYPKRRKFKSKQEAVEFLIRAFSSSSPTAWYFFSQILNPDFPGEND